MTVEPYPPSSTRREPARARSGAGVRAPSERAALAALTLAGAVLPLCGCSAVPGSSDVADEPEILTAVGTQPAESAPPRPEPTTADAGSAAADPTRAGAARPTPGQADPAAGCSGLTGQQALAKWIGQVEEDGYPWDPEYAETENYDPCAALSWITLPIKGATASSPFQIMLFHRGDYLGTTTAEAQGYHPQVSRDSDNQITVVYQWANPGEPTALASGRSTARFRWDDAEQRVIMTGTAPSQLRE